MAGIFGKLFSEEQRELSALEKIADQVLKYEPEMQHYRMMSCVQKRMNIEKELRMEKR